MNPRLTAEDRGLLKGAINRAFTRSALYKEVMEAAAIEHIDLKKPRCKNWVWCNICGLVFPRWLAAVDHINPKVPVNTTFELMNIDEYINNTWCDKKDLQVVDPVCHDIKTDAERQLRKGNGTYGKRKKRKAA